MLCSVFTQCCREEAGLGYLCQRNCLSLPFPLWECAQLSHSCWCEEKLPADPHSRCGASVAFPGLLHCKCVTCGSGEDLAGGAGWAMVSCVPPTAAPDRMEDSGASVPQLGLCHVLGVKGQDTGMAIDDLVLETHCSCKHPRELLWAARRTLWMSCSPWSSHCCCLAWEARLLLA